MTSSSLLAISALLVVSFALVQAGLVRVTRQAIPKEFQNINLENYFKVCMDTLNRFYTLIAFYILFWSLFILVVYFLE